VEVTRFVKILRRAAIAGTAFAAVVILAAVLTWISNPRRIVISEPFVARALDINVLDYYDTGAVDINRDGHLDLFTTNHSSRQSLLISDGSGDFTDRLTEYGLDQVTDLPGLEDTGRPPEISAPGLYMYFVGSVLHLRNVAPPGPVSISGSLQIPGRPEVVRNTGYEIERIPATSTDRLTRLNFTVVNDGELAISLTKSAPITVSLNDAMPLDMIFVGAKSINPRRHEIELYLKDRHGIAWADINSDMKLDAYMSRGALFGTLADLPGELGDQFFVSNAEGDFAESFSELGFEKRDCPARQVAWTDFNNDGLLDLYVACGRQVGGFWEYVPTALRRSRDEAPNMLYQQMAAGNFQEVAGDYGLDFAVGGTFLWFDVDLDGDADLLWASENEVSLYRNTDSEFSREVLLPDSTTIQARKLAAADFDSDGDLDVYVAASVGSNLLINDGGTLRAENTNSRGLPSRVRTIAWVDYDNDGNMDLYAWPAGLFRQTSTGEFEETGLLRMPSHYWALVDPRVLWFDYDNDGDRDFLLMQRFFPQAIQKSFPNAMPFSVDFLINEAGRGKNWIQVDLLGPAGNREAIGSTITLHTTAYSEVQEVGQFDSSHYSQGHYRLYFSVANNVSVDRLEVRWPDQSVQQFLQPETGQLIRIEKRPPIDAIK
jgi:hypothetical protein